jgi:hypothetical protein
VPALERSPDALAESLVEEHATAIRARHVIRGRVRKRIV